jgi:hypothetical protein
MTDREPFVAEVLERYRAAPDTPGRCRQADRRLAEALFDRGVSLEAVAAAIRLATVRRRCRPPALPPLEPIRSLHYFHPVITEILRHPLEPAYLEYLADKMQRLGLALTPPEPVDERPDRP